MKLVEALDAAGIELIGEDAVSHRRRARRAAHERGEPCGGHRAAIAHRVA